ncbi:hypothetical protein F2Q69_00005506 [Brassica cretica]|uniref:Uncharacterized protein n=1 Tax=Brassica cretica TaxID=69181 RepID=A0A8S9P2T8_BRACR|nr:hypothetical protein F2Q69_00005506 [Brassica cretica]
MKIRGLGEVYWVRLDRNEEIFIPIGSIVGYRGFFANQGIVVIYVSETETAGHIMAVGGLDGDGAQATSYKVVVAHGNSQSGERREHQQTRSQNNRGGDKGKGIVYEKQGSSKQDRRRGMQSRGAQPRGVVPRGHHLAIVAEGEQQLPDPTKLMFDAFKGVGKYSGEEAPIGVEVEGSGGQIKARKALLFEESSSARHDLVSTEEGVELAGPLALKMQSEDEDAAQKLDERVLHTQALDDANMMLEGELLSDSELLLEEGEELEDWEHGEITDVMEEEVQVAEGVEEGVQFGMEADAGETEVFEEGKAPLKKGAKVGTGGNSKKRLGPGLVSPGKKLLAKVAARAGDKGAKKASRFRFPVLLLCRPWNGWSVLIINGCSVDRYLSEAVSWPGWTLREGSFFSGYGGLNWDIWSYVYAIFSKDWYLAGDEWWRKEYRWFCRFATLLGIYVRSCAVCVVRFLIVDKVLTIMIIVLVAGLVSLFVSEKRLGTRRWRDARVVDALNQQGWWVSALGYIVSHGVSALCVWYGFGSQIVTTEISEAEVGVTRRVFFLYSEHMV